MQTCPVPLNELGSVILPLTVKPWSTSRTVDGAPPGSLTESTKRLAGPPGTSWIGPDSGNVMTNLSFLEVAFLPCSLPALEPPLSLPKVARTAHVVAGFRYLSLDPRQGQSDSWPHYAGPRLIAG